MAKQLVNCETHGDRLGYITCIHVAAHTTVPIDTVPASRDYFGVLVCKSCAEMTESGNVDYTKLKLVCEVCAALLGLFTRKN